MNKKGVRTIFERQFLCSLHRRQKNSSDLLSRKPVNPSWDEPERVSTDTAKQGVSKIADCVEKLDSTGFLLSSSDPFFGFTLLEVILALAILAGALAALGEVMRLADRNAAMTRDETQAQIIAASIMDELAAGARALTGVKRAVFDEDLEQAWLYSIVLEQTGYEELVAVRVVVEQQLEARLQPARFELVRWMPNPNHVPADTGGEP